MNRITCARTYLAASLLALSLISAAGARIITVDDDAPADFNNIQAAIHDANDRDVVEIQPGTYTGPGNYDIRFNGKAITVRGTNPDEFDVVAATVIDCNSQGRGFVFHSGEDANSILSGITVTNAYDYDSSYPGGAVGCRDSSPLITNCILTGNHGQGGGFGARGGKLVVKNCIITRNTSSRYGGGIYTTLNESLTVENCIIADNTADQRGGGIRTRAVNLTVRNSLIVGNKAGEYGGAIAITNNYYLLIEGCTIVGNVAGNIGGAVRAYSVWDSSTEVTNSILSDNYAPVGPEVGFDYFGGDTNLSITWSNIRGGQDSIFLDPDYLDPNSTLDWGPGNIDVDPCFADPGYWGHIADPNIHIEPNDPNATWVDAGDDYHLKSQAGRWIADEGQWTIDDVTSLCIDAGDPIYPIGPEPFPNGGKRNIGAYGGTVEASKSYFGKSPCQTIVAGDINGDCVVDGRDFALMARKWLLSNLEPPSPWLPSRATDPYPADGTVDPLFTRGGLDLTWQAGHRAESHDVYFGTVSPGEFKGNQTETEFNAGSAFTSGTYYWRIDEINAHGKTTGAVWSFSISPPGAATDPYPADGATGVCAGRGDIFSLSWTGGERVETHDIYFGTVSPGEFQGSQTTYDTDFSLGPALLTGTYFWRIDEVSGDVTTIGPVWTFTVEGPPAATDPYPPDGAEHTSVPLVLSWQPGGGAETHDVYFGTESPGDFQGNQTGTTFDPGTLESERTYYWRIDEISNCGKTTGSVWTFNTSAPDQPTDPYPADGATYTSTLVTLSWQPGAGAETHDVYFGTESPGEFQGNQASPTFTPPVLESDQTYYWRIDEINSYGTTTGPVWQFACMPSR